MIEATESGTRGYVHWGLFARWMVLAWLALTATLTLLFVYDGLQPFSDLKLLIVMLAFAWATHLPGTAIALYQWMRTARQREWFRERTFGQLSSLLLLQLLATIYAYSITFIWSEVWSAYFDVDRDLGGRAPTGVSIPSLWQLMVGLLLHSGLVAPMIVLPRLLLARRLRRAGYVG